MRVYIIFRLASQYGGIASSSVIKFAGPDDIDRRPIKVRRECDSRQSRIPSVRSAENPDPLGIGDPCPL